MLTFRIACVAVIVIAGAAVAAGNRDGADYPPRCSTYLGGPGLDYPWVHCVAAVPGTARVVVAGFTYSNNLRVTPGALHGGLATPGTRDVYICCLDLAAAGADQFVWGAAGAATQGRDQDRLEMKGPSMKLASFIILLAQQVPALTGATEIVDRREY